MNYPNFFILDFHSSANGPTPSFADLERSIRSGPVEVQPFETWIPGHPPRLSGSSALRYSLHQREETTNVSLRGEDSEVVVLITSVLKSTKANASLQVGHRPVLTRVDGQLRLDLQRFWTPQLLKIVGKEFDFVRARVLYDFPEYGFVQQQYSDPMLPPSSAPNMYLQRPVLPAVVIGGEPLTVSGPGWVHSFQHQHGGYGCLQFRCSGAVLPLHLNRAAARLNPDELLDGLEAMAEEPDHPVLSKHYPALKPLAHTHDDLYRQQELETLHQFLSRSYRIPKFSFGREALLDFEDCDPLDWFAGWEMVQLESEQTVTYNKDTHRQLQEWYGEKLNCYFLWNNSD